MAAAPASGELLAVALDAAEAAGDLLLSRFGTAAAGVRAKSTPTDLVSEADEAAERAIRALLAERRPRDAVLGEEGGEGPAPAGGSGLRWVVDPLDGTINYLFGIPLWSVSVACEDAEGTVAGVVHHPAGGETFAATRDSAPTLNGAPITASRRDDLATALVATGFAYDAPTRARQAAVVAGLLPQVRDIRRCGSAALDLAWTAAGRYDAYFERGSHAWDVAAGALICRRAGVDVRDLPPRDGLPEGLLAAPPALAGPLAAIVG
ncbi:MAG: inositol monophosphatase family protein [Solirubrobacteraceae bacterium]